VEFLAAARAAGDPLTVLEALDCRAAAHIAVAQSDSDWAGPTLAIEELRVAADRQREPSYQSSAAIHRAAVAVANNELNEAEAVLESAATLVQEIDPETPLYESPNSLPLLYAKLELAIKQQNFVGAQVLENQIQTLEMGGEPLAGPGPLASLAQSIRRPAEQGTFARISWWVFNIISILVLLRWFFGALGLLGGRW
jgi:hypothetical protein